MTRTCGCRDIIDAARHRTWHRQISPLLAADAATLETACGRPSSPFRTFVDDQFDAERAREDARRKLAAAVAS